MRPFFATVAIACKALPINKVIVPYLPNKIHEENVKNRTAKQKNRIGGICACYFLKDVVYYGSTCRCDGMVDVVDSKSTAGDSVPVRVRSPAPEKAPYGVLFQLYSPCGELYWLRQLYLLRKWYWASPSFRGEYNITSASAEISLSRKWKYHSAARRNITNN